MTKPVMSLSVVFPSFFIHGLPLRVTPAMVTCSSAIWSARLGLSSIPEGYLPRLKEAFRFRSDYTVEIVHATDLGWYLTKYGDDLNPHLQAKRALWCIRTILIARSAEHRDPIFAPQLLAEQARSAAARDLLIRRHSARDAADVRAALRLFLEEETTIAHVNEQADRRAFIERFRTTRNKVALKTLQQEEESQAGYS